jgi:hypothetical protein
VDWERHFRSMKRQPPSSFGADFGVIGPSPNADNLLATNSYIQQATVKTAKASNLQADWAKWWLATGNPENYYTYVPDSVWDEGRNRRLAFDLANAITPAETQQVIAVATNGTSTEQAQGLPDRRDPATGFIPVPGLDPNTGATKPPAVPTWVKPVFMGAVAVGLGISVLPIIKKILLPIP